MSVGSAWRNALMKDMNLWVNGTCSKVVIAGGIERWKSELDADCCMEGTLLGATQRSVGTCIAWLLVLCWIFLGVAMGADVFMASIEVITSKDRSKKVVLPDGSTKMYHTRVWNATVANLTLMALGSSAPEILLNVMEVLLGDFNAGELGPSTIVGSAAFNLMVITAVCIVCLPPGETRTLKQLNVFLCTAFFSVLAYIWLYLIVVSISPEVIEVWEGAMTMGFMVLLVIFAFIIDKHGEKENQMRVQRSQSGLMDMSVAAAVLANNDLGKDATPEEIREALEKEVPKTRAHYRRKAMQNHVGAAQSQKKKAKPAQVGVADESEPVEEPKPRVSKKQGSLSSAPPTGFIRWRQHVYEVKESGGFVTVVAERVGGMNGEVSVSYKTKNQKAVAGKDYIAAEGKFEWADGEGGEKSVDITIVDDDALEKDEEFTVVMSDIQGGATFPLETDGGIEEEVCTVIIVNDDLKAKKVQMAFRMLKMDADSLDLAGADYMEQVRGIFVTDDPSPKGLIMHVLTMPWKILFGIMPPPGFCGGWPCFVLSLVGIGFQVVLISDFATQMGCQMYIKNTVTAITFVALGTSLPDTFASMTAARGDKWADNSIGNVTGSNSVNVFFGLGLPWLIGACYWAAAGANSEWVKLYHPINGEKPLPSDIYEKWMHKGAFVVRKGDLGFSVIVFTVCAIITLSLVLVRRKMGNQELGGNKPAAIACAVFLCFLWVIYVLLSTLTTYHIIEPGI